ncbi:hypothetical protein IJG78_03275 [Candidatus Saccharibacteria bacterium]|nr:hypothetical protein [Candidatus Saccharibacteria bacterium]
MNNKRGVIIKPAGCRPWPHEERVADILALAGHKVEFILKTNYKTADILLDGVEFEIKSPESFNTNTLEHTLKNATKQSPNIIIDSSRIKKTWDNRILIFLINQARKQKQIKKLLFITKRGKIIDVSSLI